MIPFVIARILLFLVKLACDFAATSEVAVETTTLGGRRCAKPPRLEVARTHLTRCSRPRVAFRDKVLQRREHSEKRGISLQQDNETMAARLRGRPARELLNTSDDQELC